MKKLVILIPLLLGGWTNPPLTWSNYSGFHNATIKEPITWSNFWYRKTFMIDHWINYYKMQRWDKAQEKKKEFYERLPKPIYGNYCNNICG